MPDFGEKTHWILGANGLEFSLLLAKYTVRIHCKNIKSRTKNVQEFQIFGDECPSQVKKCLFKCATILLEFSA